MANRRLAVSEARRLLPEIVRTIAEEGGRIDVTVRGEPRVSIVRTADLGRQRSGRTQSRGPVPDALRVEFVIESGALVEVIRNLRSRVGRARAVTPRRRERSRRRP